MGYDDYEGFDFEDEGSAQRDNGPKALRDALKAAKQRIAELEEGSRLLEAETREHRDQLGEARRAGVRQAVPWTSSCRPPIHARLWYSRQ